MSKLNLLQSTIAFFSILIVISSVQFFSQTPTTATNTNFSQDSIPVKQAHTHTHQHGDFCAFDHLRKKHPSFQKKQDSLDNVLAQLIKKGQVIGGHSRAVLTIPVVVHVVHNNGIGNLPLSQVQVAIQHLNDAYANVGYYNPNTGVDVEIQFCLAQRDPAGNTTNGVTYTVSPLSNLNMNTQDLQLKNTIRWNPTEYVNIWSVTNIMGGVAGYAYFPSAHGTNVDGIVIEAGYMGSSPANSSVLVHEMGHYLGLYHPFEGGCPNNDCLVDGDKVCDTPPDNTTSRPPCSTPPNSCTTDEDDATPNNPFRATALGGLGDQPDLIQDYMDYSDFNCYDRFTQGQKDRMRFFLTGTRASLLNSMGCTPACPNPINIGFTASATTVNIGTNVTFTNTTPNATAYEWFYNGTSIATTTNTNHTFNTLGTHTILLEATNGNPNCTVQDSVTITVTCPVSAEFTYTSSSSYPAPGELLTFNNNSSNATSYTWTVNGVQFSTNANPSYTFSAEGTYTVCLTASNSLCSSSYCQTLLVFEDTVDCGNTFIRTFGSTTSNEYGKALEEAPDNGFFLGGGKADSAYLVKLDASGNPTWQRSFKFTNVTNEFITDLKVDSDSNLIAIGYADNGTTGDCFAFKYDYRNHTVLWSREWTGNDRSRFLSVHERSAGGNYFITGQTSGNSAPGLGCDGLFLELDRNNGSIIQIEHYNLGSCETFSRSILHNNLMYITGRYNNAGGGTAQMRQAITEMTFGGVENWTRLYISNVSSTARLYGTDLLVHNDSLVAIGQGDDNGTSATDVEAFLYKTDLSGQVAWAKKYNIVGGNTERIRRIIILPDGYLMSGFYNSTTASNEVFLIKTDFLGNIQWAKTYGTPQNETSNDLLVIGGSIFLVGDSEGLGGSTDSDLLFAKLDLDGNVLDTCTYIGSLNVTTTNVVNPYDGSHPLSNYNRSEPFNSTNISSVATNLTTNSYCEAPCQEICDNGIDDDGNGFVDCEDDACDCNICTDKAGDNWYFGNQAAISFASGVPVALTNSNMSAAEGSASISDPTGNLLFYTNGQTVYDNTHNVMQNGLGLTGSQISAQSAIIVPQPQNDSLYYIFTVSNWTDPSVTLRYSIVNINANNGQGAVISKNVTLHSPVAERVTATYHANCQDIWIVSHEHSTNNYIAYLLTDSGVSSTAVISAVGANHVGGNRYGGLRMSHDGQKLCSTLGGSTTQATVELFDFDKQTGIVSNPIVLATNNEMSDAYSSEFSSDNKKLYVCEFNDNLIMQYDLVLPPALIAASATDIAQTTSTFKRSLQMGPDNKIYVSTPGQSLGVINFPNVLGASCGYADNAISLQGGFSSLGLPNFLPDLFEKGLYLSGPDTVCTGDSVQFFASERICETYGYDWWTNGNATVQSTQDSSATIYFGNTGQATIYVRRFDLCDTLVDSTVVYASCTCAASPPTLDLGPDTTVCENGIFTFNAGSGFASYRWQDGHPDSTYTAFLSGTYWVDAITTCGDTLRDTVAVLIDSVGLVSLNADTTICNGDSVSIAATFNPSYTYQWSPTNKITCDSCANVKVAPATTTTYNVVVTNSTGCVSVDSIIVNVNDCDSLNFNDTTLCQGDTLLLDATLATATGYSWQDGTTTSQYTVSNSGNYQVTIDLSSGNVIIANMTATFVNCDSIFTSTMDTTRCQGDTLILDASLPNATTYQWQDGSTTNTFSVSTNGTYWSRVTVSNGNVYLDSFNVNFIDCNPTIISVSDTTLCDGDNLLLDVTVNNAVSYQWSDGDSTSQKLIDSAGTYQVTVTLSNGTARTDQIVISYEDCDTDCDIVAPNAFTPNGDGNNDAFRLVILGNCEISNYQMKIYNRWGQEVFGTTDQLEGWDGTLNGVTQPRAAYIYLVTYTLETANGSEEHQYKGQLTLIR